jgi:hypothetical protein
LTIIGNIVLLNLFLAILLREFEDDDEGTLTGNEFHFSQEFLKLNILSVWQRIKRYAKKAFVAAKECLGAEIDEGTDKIETI